ncbi:MAG: Ldh family oxidoreductase [Xanthobacteraceae bacterium]
MSERTLVVHQDLHRFIRNVLAALGASEADAGAVADGLVWANLRGGDGHGISRLPRYLQMIKRGEIDITAKSRLVHDRPATFVIDSGHGFGPPACMQAAALAVERAKAIGVCFGLVRATTHTGAIGRYAQWVAQQDCAALVIGGGMGPMAFHGARVVSMGTNPIAIAVPTGQGAPMVFDMATSTISNGKILQARATGTPLPAGTVLTGDGEPTTDPSKAEILLPLGGAKGSGLSLMFEMLASVLGAAPIYARILGAEKLASNQANLAILAVDVASFRPLADFERDADELITILKSLPRQAGFDEVTMPGERSARTEAARRKNGIPIPTKLWRELEDIARVQSVKMPPIQGT